MFACRPVPLVSFVSLYRGCSPLCLSLLAGVIRSARGGGLTRCISDDSPSSPLQKVAPEYWIRHPGYQNGGWLLYEARRNNKRVPLDSQLALLFSAPARVERFRAAGEVRREPNPRELCRLLLGRRSVHRWLTLVRPDQQAGAETPTRGGLNITSPHCDFGHLYPCVSAKGTNSRQRNVSAEEGTRSAAKQPQWQLT